MQPLLFNLLALVVALVLFGAAVLIGRSSERLSPVDCFGNAAT
jgi:hypothetical protein